MAAIPYLALLVCIAGTLMALICIMAFFLGTSGATIYPFIWLQLALAALVLPTIFLVRSKNSTASRKTPAWLWVALVVVFSLMLLGEIAVLVAWLKVRESSTYLYHLPSICIIVFGIAFRANTMRLLETTNDPFANH